MSDAFGEERRRHARRVVRLPIYVALPDRIYQKMVAVEARNISEGGLLFETHTALPVASESRIMVSRLGRVPDSAHIDARIVHCRANGNGGSYLVGVRFQAFVDITAAELFALIEAETGR